MPAQSHTLTEKLFAAHAASKDLAPGADVALTIDQTLTQDATGTMVMLELEAIGLERVRTRLSAQYVDHNLLQEDHKNPDDHLFLESACERFGVWFSRAGNGVSHPLHMEHFSVPGQTLLGSDSHTCANGAMGMLAIGSGGLEVALAMAGKPFHLVMPRVFGTELVGRLAAGVSAKDVILELLRRHGVSGARGFVLEYFGEGLSNLSIWDRHVIANMGAELGATSSVFPADETARQFLVAQGREGAFQALGAEPGAHYDRLDRVDLSQLVPLIAKPSSPGRVVPVSDVAGTEIYQAYIGSSANPGYRDYAVAALMVRGQQVHAGVSFDINPSTNRVLRELSQSGLLSDLLAAGARLHQAGCNGCIGMGQAPATGRNSLRTTPRNFPGRSGTQEDSVWLCSPETAAASALRGCIQDPRAAVPSEEIPSVRLLDIDNGGLKRPPPRGAQRELVKGPNIKALPELEPLPDALSARLLLKLGDDVSTDEILPAGARVLPFRSNIERISDFCFEGVDPDYVSKAREETYHAILAGENYGQGSSREHAALALRFLGLALVLARSFSRIHRQNLINFGVLPLLLTEPSQADPLEPRALLRLDKLHDQVESGNGVRIMVSRGGKEWPLEVEHDLSPRERGIVRAGSVIQYLRKRAA